MKNESQIKNFSPDVSIANTGAGQNRAIVFLLCVLLVFSTLLYGAVHQPILVLFYLAIGAIALLWLWETFRSGSFRFNKSFLQVPIAAAGIYGLIQTIPFGVRETIAGVAEIPRTISLEPFSTQISAFHFFALLIFFAAALTFINSARALQNIVLLITIFGFAYSFFAILQYVLSPGRIYGIFQPQVTVPFGSFINRHNFASFVEMTIALPLGLMFAGAIAKDKRLLYITAIALMGVALIMSGSRGGLVALFAEVLFLVFLTSKDAARGGKIIRVAAALALISTIVVGAIMIGGETSLTRFAETAVSKDITTDRAHIWSVAIEIAKNYFPFGSGLGTFGFAYTQFDSMNGLARVEQAHNDYLQVIADAGLIGALIGAAFLFLFFRAGFKSAKVSNTFRRGVAVGSFAGALAILVHSIFDFVLHTPAIAIMFLMLCALMIISSRRFEDDIRLPHEKRRRRSSADVMSLDDSRVSRASKE